MNTEPNRRDAAQRRRVRLPRNRGDNPRHTTLLMRSEGRAGRQPGTSLPSREHEQSSNRARPTTAQQQPTKKRRLQGCRGLPGSRKPVSRT